MSVQLKRPNNVYELGRKRKQSSQSWTLSYGDMVTALLCFFIIFYAIEKQYEKKNTTAAAAGLEEHKSSDIELEYAVAVDQLKEIQGVQVFRTSAFTDIHFKEIVFFEKGQYELTEDGKKVIHDVLSKLKKIDSKYLLEIQGHADSSPVKKERSRWWRSNMELSVLRSLNVHSYLSENYIHKDNLIVSGYGSQKKINESDEDINRRITLRLQLIK